MRRKINVLPVLGLLAVLGGCQFDSANKSPGLTDTSEAAGAKSATLSWEVPTQNTNGTPLTDLEGYAIVYGTSPDAMTEWVQISDITATSHEISGLAQGTWYFAVLSLTTSGVDSALSNIVTKTIN